MLLGHPLIVQPTFYSCTRDWLLFLLILKVLVHAVSVNMSVADWTFFFHQIYTSSHDRGNETRDAHESFFGTAVLILMARLASCERTGLFVTQQLCSAKADGNFWDNNWSHMPELRGRHLTWLQKMAPIFLLRNLTVPFQCFMLFEGLCGMFLTCGSVSSTCPAVVISSSLLECDCLYVYYFSSNQRCLKPPSVRDILPLTVYDRHIQLSSLFLCLLV